MNSPATQGMPRIESLDDQEPRSRFHAMRLRSVERVVETLRQSPRKPYTLEELAEIACLSPYHFNRVFRATTGIPPAQFLCAVRLETAKRLLVETVLSVTEVCYEVGYKSLGTFTTRFTNLVGVAPKQFRDLAQRFDGVRLDFIRDRVESFASRSASDSDVVGRIQGPGDFSGLIFVGLFRRPIPESRPVACTLLSAPGIYRLPSSERGRHFIFSAASSWDADFRDLLTLKHALRGRTKALYGDTAPGAEETNIVLLARQAIHPPILAPIPILVMQHMLSSTDRR